MNDFLVRSANCPWTRFQKYSVPRLPDAGAATATPTGNRTRAAGPASPRGRTRGVALRAELAPREAPPRPSAHRTGVSEPELQPRLPRCTAALRSRRADPARGSAPTCSPGAGGRAGGCGPLPSAGVGLTAQNVVRALHREPAAPGAPTRKEEARGDRLLGPDGAGSSEPMGRAADAPIPAPPSRPGRLAPPLALAPPPYVNWAGPASPGEAGRTSEPTPLGAPPTPAGRWLAPAQFGPTALVSPRPPPPP